MAKNDTPVLGNLSSANGSAVISVDSPFGKTRLSIHFANNGPPMIPAGNAIINEYHKTVPKLASKIPIAAIAPGCGGTSPCTIDNPAIPGNAINKIFFFVAF